MHCNEHRTLDGNEDWLILTTMDGVSRAHIGWQAPFPEITNDVLPSFDRKPTAVRAWLASSCNTQTKMCVLIANSSAKQLCSVFLWCFFLVQFSTNNYSNCFHILTQNNVRQYYPYLEFNKCRCQDGERFNCEYNWRRCMTPLSLVMWNHPSITLHYITLHYITLHYISGSQPVVRGPLVVRSHMSGGP